MGSRLDATAVDVLLCMQWRVHYGGLEVIENTEVSTFLFTNIVLS